MEVVEELEKLLADVPVLHNQLILLIGPPGSVRRRRFWHYLARCLAQHLADVIRKICTLFGTFKFERTKRSISDDDSSSICRAGHWRCLAAPIGWGVVLVRQGCRKR